MSIKYEVIRRLGVRAGGTPPAFPPEQRQPDALSAAGSPQGRDPRQGRTTLCDDDSFFRQCFEQRKTLASKLGYAEIPHDSSVHRNVQDQDDGRSQTATDLMLQPVVANSARRKHAIGPNRSWEIPPNRHFDGLSATRRGAATLPATRSFDSAFSSNAFCPPGQI